MGLEIVLLKEDSTEWNYIWEWLRVHPLNQGLEEPTLALNEGEAWMYMGTYELKGEFLHTLRHRLHPVTNNVQYISLRASKDMNPSMIASKK